MSAPVNAFQQPPFSQDEAAATESKPAEPSNDELNPVKPSTPNTASKGMGGGAWMWLVSLILVVTSPWSLPWLLSVRSHADNEPKTTPYSQSQQLPSELTCTPDEVEIEQVEIDKYGEEYLSPYCATQAEYDSLITQAEAQYVDSLKRGKPVYTKWLTANKLGKVKTESARETAARTYICQIEPNFGDGAFYAATKTGADEGVIDIYIDSKIVEVDGYDPTYVYCEDGKPGVRPDYPVPSVLPKELDRYPVPIPEGGAGSNNGPVDAP